jgi:hypothetical protein
MASVLIFSFDFPQISAAARQPKDVAKPTNWAAALIEPTTRFKDQRKSVGGPRDGSGGAVMAAMCAAAMGCTACASGEGWVNVVLNSGGGSVIDVHKGQSIVFADPALSSSPCTTSFIMPVPVHTTSMALGLNTGEATATPIDNTNHTNMRRVMWRALRSWCMVEIMTQVKNQSKGTAVFVHTHVY